MHIIDLTHRIFDGVSTYQGGSSPVFEWNATFETRGRTSTRFKMSSHTGTHIDAPLHFVPNGMSIDNVTLETLVGPATLIKVTDLPRQGRFIDRIAFKQAASSLRNGDIAIVYSGMDRYFGEPAFTIEFPVLTADSIHWLIDKKIKAYATDAVSIDAMDATEQLNHKTLLGMDIPIIECLANLDAISEEHCFFIALPLKLNEREAAPCRAIALKYGSEKYLDSNSPIK